MSDVGLSIGASSPLPAVELTTVSTGEITALIAPALSALYEGQRIADVTGYAEMIAETNFSSTEGSIQSAVVSFTGDVVSDGAPLLEDQIAGYTVLVADSEGNIGTFDAGSTRVEYKARVTTTSANEANIEINPLVPDSETVDVTIAGGTAYDGIYNMLPVGELRNNAFNFPGTVLLSTTGMLPGRVVNVDLGLWTTPSDSLALTQQWRRDGVGIAGATEPTYTLVTADEGATLTCYVTGDDGVNTPVNVDSASLVIPSSTGEAPIFLEGGAVSVISDVGTIPISLGSTVAGDELYIMALSADSSSTSSNRITSVSVDSVNQTLQANSIGDCRVQGAACKITVSPAQETAGSISVAVTSAGMENAFAFAYRANGWSSPDYSVGVNNGDTSVSTNVTAISDGYTIAAAADSGRSGTRPLFSVWTTRAEVQAPDNASRDGVTAEIANTAAAPFSVEATHSSGLSTHMAVVAIALA